MAYLEIAGPSNVRGPSRASEGKRTARWIWADHRSPRPRARRKQRQSRGPERRAGWKEEVAAGRKMDREAKRGQKEGEIKGMKSNIKERQRLELGAHTLIHKTPSDLISYITSLY